MPDGTVVLRPRTARSLADLVGPGTRFVAAEGGRGGLGNAALASAARKAPGFALLGEPGETRDLVLELRSIADVGLVGFPSAGKSSLVAALSAARPKIADYPFTTLVPQLGVVTAGEEVFTVADVPGLIPGASEGRGLGLDFLRHIERCSVLVHVVDCATFEPGRDPVSDIAGARGRARPLHPGARRRAGRPAAAGRAEQDRRARTRASSPRSCAAELAERFGWPVFEISAATHEGLRELTFAMAEQVRAAPGRAARRRADADGAAARSAVDDAGFTVEPDPRAAGRVHRARRAPGALDPADRTSTTTRPSATWATGWPGSASRRRWPRRGAVPGCPVTIGDVTFDWEPSTPGRGRGACSSGRGTDRRLDQSARVDGGGPARAPVSTGAGTAPTTSSSPALPRTTGVIDVDAPVSARAQLGGGAAGRGQGRVVVADQPRPAGWTPRGSTRSSTRSPPGGRRARQVVLVSSGAIAAGLAPLGLARRPRDLATQQAAAAVGQLLLAQTYGASFARHGQRIGQVLLTADDMIRRAHYRNAQRTLERLLGLDVLPVVNENDTVATDEIRVGDNDRLAALVAHIVGADGLVLLSDVDGPLRRRSAPARRPADRRGGRRPRTWRR